MFHRNNLHKIPPYNSSSIIENSIKKLNILLTVNKRWDQLDNKFILQKYKHGLSEKLACNFALIKSLMSFMIFTKMFPQKFW